ncbi:host attachment protein [Spiribacter halobius]|uniref:Host attachment protein n=1 Tax=Sediminicurvatus halobius TaxID=2182432 RepID=A0A2U2MVU7_9GAMM|nr:host attachment protein [Spiribacter halobius]PWG60991.1 host attachment protein [Spiribacter halobius]UEX77614.1 host attachment protein [Spiribacter halobius]
MSEYCVVVAEGARARFFTLERPDLPELEGGPDLMEHLSLANPRHRAHDSKVYADARSGRNRTPGGQGHAYDEHRDGHDAEMEHRFARDIARQLDGLARSNGTRRVILCAEKRMLGFLRNGLPELPGVEIREVQKDLAKLGPRELQEHLARDGLLPRRRPPAGPGS